MDLTPAEIDEITNILSVLQRIEDTMTKICGFVHGTKYMSTENARDTCYNLLQGTCQRQDLKVVMDTLHIARNTVETLNYAIEHSLESNFTRDIKSAWFNTYVIMTERDSNFKEYL
jgi:hypothetical protein